MKFAIISLILFLINQVVAVDPDTCHDKCTDRYVFNFFFFKKNLIYL